ncbi:MAG: 2-C-methyl-D-erythritol 4-phosphate cytidylyltransferase [Acidimicrobiia bacterium]
MSSRMFTIVVAAGNSTRFGSNKLLEKIGDESVLDRSVRIALENSDGVVVVTDPNSYANSNVHAIVSGGQTRSESVKNGLKQVPHDVEIIAVHDAARPFASSEIYQRGKGLIEQGNKAVIPAVNVIDTIKQVNENSYVSETIPRDELRAIQTPQIFNAEVLREAHQKFESDTDDAALVEKLDIKVIVYEGAQENIKITTRQDLDRIKSKTSIQRIGSGYDIHPFTNDDQKKLILGGVEFSYRALEGHSDSDAVFHALTDALLSAIGAQDLGSMFPASIDENKNRNSGEFLVEATKLIAKENLFVNNISIIINAEQPKLRDTLDSMKKNIESILAPIYTQNSIISITPKHGEGVGEIGEGKAIAVYATVLLSN